MSATSKHFSSSDPSKRGWSASRPPNREISGAELEKLLQRMIAHQKFLETVERRGHPREIVEALLSAGADREYFADKDKLEGVAREADDADANGDGTAGRRAQPLSAAHRGSVERLPAAAHHRRRFRHGRRVPDAARQPPRYPDARRRHRRVHHRRGAVPTPRTPTRRRPTDAKPAKTKVQPPDVTLHSLDELVEFFITAGKKGIAINRYKGLGEMNPDQLWSTTMDPTVRTLLQVRAEDHTEADLMFTTLMGDQVEPRRKFIEDNALDVKNLDV